MSDVPLDLSSDVVQKMLDDDRLFQKIGFDGEGDFQRFLNPWGVQVTSMPWKTRPVGVTFILLPPPSSSPPEPKLPVIATLLEELRLAQENHQLLSVSYDGTVASRTQLRDDIRRMLDSGGSWPSDLAERLSRAFPDKCVCWASGLSFKAFVDGRSVKSYQDVLNRTLETAAETAAKQGWGDGELLDRCGEEQLCDHSQIGIWFHANEHVLKHRPETLIQQRLDLFLRGYMSGYKSLEREVDVPSEGRVDLKIIRADDSCILVEVKWVGRSIKADHEHRSEKELETEFKSQWDAPCVSVFRPEDAKAGLKQLAHYMKNLSARKGYLAVYDCRRPDEAEGPAFASTYPEPDELRGYKYRVRHIAVNPRSASVKSKQKSKKK